MVSPALSTNSASAMASCSLMDQFIFDRIPPRKALLTIKSAGDKDGVETTFPSVVSASSPMIKRCVQQGRRRAFDFG